MPKRRDSTLPTDTTEKIDLKKLVEESVSIYIDYLVDEKMLHAKPNTIKNDLSCYIVAALESNKKSLTS